MINHRVASVLALALLVLTARSEAAPITLTTGQSAVFNWNLPAQGIAGPFTSIDVIPNQFITAGSSYLGEIYTGLNAGGSVFDSGTNKPTFFLVAPELDGVFSLRISNVVGSITVNPDVEGHGADFFEGVLPLAPAAAVPEPATLSLLGLGLACTGARRWRRRELQ